MLEGLRKKETAANSKKITPAGAKAREKWSLYILRCCDGSFYTGITNDPARRFRMHQNGKASRYTRTRRPVEMLYQEKCGSRSAALVRECEVKEWPRAKKENLIKTGPRTQGHGPR